MTWSVKGAAGLTQRARLLPLVAGSMLRSIRLGMPELERFETVDGPTN
jgi:hypothetical protein